MTKFDEYINDEAKASLLRERIAKFAIEGYQHELNLKFAEEAGDSEAAHKSQQSIEIIEAAIALHERELVEIPVAEVVLEETTK